MGGHSFVFPFHRILITKRHTSSVRNGKPANYFTFGKANQNGVKATRIIFDLNKAIKDKPQGYDLATKERSHAAKQVNSAGAGGQKKLLENLNEN